MKNISENLKQHPISISKTAYRDYLISKEYAKSTISTSINDAFYIWKHTDAATFWEVVESDNFEEDAKSVLQEVLNDNSSAGPIVYLSNYLTHLRNFRKFYLLTEIQGNDVKNKESYLSSL